MGSIVYRETFASGPGGWMTWLGPNQPAAPEIIDNALISCSPWGIDSNHAHPGGGYLHLPVHPVHSASAQSGSSLWTSDDRKSLHRQWLLDRLANVRLTARLKGEANLRGAKLVLHCQSRIGDKAINFV
ncbi:hypothetical protein KFU94_51520, partial [Chloroflexi bacterium TSY]|nr:hypothetical protein [Chloroflexi bacterium TSY]